jgi:transcription initiation factor TFIIH subunit 4
LIFSWPFRILMSLSKPSSRRFSPTRLATTLTSSSPPLPTSTGTSSGPQEGFIILETNYRVYAYTGTPFFCVMLPFWLPSHVSSFTDNPLQTAVLNLFVSLKYRFPNLVVGSITRDSVKKALMNGRTADQVPLPPTLLNQDANMLNRATDY